MLAKREEEKATHTHKERKDQTLRWFASRCAYRCWEYWVLMGSSAPLAVLAFFSCPCLSQPLPSLSLFVSLCVSLWWQRLSSPVKEGGGRGGFRLLCFPTVLLCRHAACTRKVCSLRVCFYSGAQARVVLLFLLLLC